MSFADTGLLDEIAKSGKCVLRYKQIEKLRKIAEELGMQKGLKKGIKLAGKKVRKKGGEKVSRREQRLADTILQSI